MKHSAVLRLTTGICFYYSLLTVFDIFHVWRLPMALFTLLCLLLGLVIVHCKNPLLRLCLSVLPSLAFLTGPFSLPLFLPLLAGIYYCSAMGKGNYAMPLDDYRRNYTLMMVICLFFVAGNIANSTVYLNHPLSLDNLVYSFFFLILGIFSMRRMQMRAKMSPSWHLRNLLTVIGIPLLSAGAALLLFLLLRFSRQALKVILAPVGRFFIWLFSKLFPAGNSPVEEMTLEEYMQHDALPLEWELEAGFNSEVQDNIGADTNVLLIERAASIGGWILLGLLLLLALILVWRFARRDRSVEEEDLIYEDTDAVSVQGGRRRKKSIPLLAGNARQLRRIYKTYLEYRAGEGMNILPSETSAEILENDREMSESADALRLRELYLAARYGDPSSVTREQVQQAQTCLERIIGKTNV